MKAFLNDIASVLQPVILTILTFLAPIYGIVLTVIFFVFFDTFIAYWRVKKTGVNWTSKKLRIGLVPKCLTYVSLIVAFFLMDKFILNDVIKHLVNIEYFTTKVLSLIFIYIEFTSIDESYKIVKGKSLLTSFKELINKANDIKNDFKNFNEDKEK